MIYDKSGNVLAGPTALDSFGSGACASGFGDGIVLYDQMADRWMLSEFAGSGNHLCIYISDGPDPVNDGWYAYDFITPNFPDYPKYGVWPDAYYVSSNENSPAVYALDRAKMLNGQGATAQRFTAPSLSGFGFQALIPSDLDGATAPPAGAPNYFMRHRDDEAHNGGSNNPTEDYLEIWPFHVDFDTPANSTFTGPINIPIAEIDSELCGFFAFACFPQQGSGTTLDPLREVIMFRLQYRNFGAYETLVGNLVTDVDGTDHGGIRWFELRKSGGGAWTLYQEGTYAPDANDRWMGAISMDGAGNIAVGYNVTSSSMFPSLRYTGRLASDPLGTMPQGEGTLINGSAANASNRYGDYSAMSVDPVDDCTFWFTGEYNASSSWSTRIGSFKFDACGDPDFTISATPPELAVCTGTDAVYTVNIGQISGYTDPVTLSSSGEPAGTTTGFSSNPVTPPNSSTMTIGNTAVAAAGNYTIDISGTSTSGIHMTQVNLEAFDAAPAAPTLTSPSDGAVNVLISPTFNWTAVANATSYSIEIATDAGFTNVVDSATGLNVTTYSTGIVLDPQTTYYWRVWADNICGQGAYSSTFNFTTGDVPPATLYCSGPTVGFEDGSFPSDWSTSSNAVPSGQWVVSTDNSSPFWNPGPAPEGSYYASANDDLPGNIGSDGSVDYLYTNVIDLSSISAATLNFQYFYNGAWGHLADVQVSPDGGTTWDTNIPVPEGDDWQTYNLDLSAYAGNNNVMVRWHSDDDGGWAGGYAVDDISLDCDQQAQTDYSDGPVSYGVASHIDPAPTAARTLWLGATVTNDPAPTPPGHDDASDDGVMRTGPWISGNNADVTVTVTGADGWIAGWVDWDGNGSFETPAELVLDQAVTSGINNLSIAIPVTYVTGTSVEVRFRLYANEPVTPDLAPTSAAEPVGEVEDGEVEDYTWNFTTTAVDLNTFSGTGVGTSPILVIVTLLSAILLGFGLFIRRRRIE